MQNNFLKFYCFSSFWGFNKKQKPQKFYKEYTMGQLLQYGSLLLSILTLCTV